MGNMGMKFFGTSVEYRERECEQKEMGNETRMASSNWNPEGLQ